MPRQGRGRSAPPRRPAAAPTRSASSANVPARTAPPPPAMQQQGQQPRQPGLFGQMASTAAGVAVGSSIGHTIGAGLSGMFGGGSSAPAEGQQQEQLPTQQQAAWGSDTFGARSCEGDARAFTKCMDEYSGDLTTCGWYLEQLKACQSAARPY